MNYIWSAMIITGIIFACINGQIPVFCDGLMQSCTDAVQFIISIAGVMALWTGLMNIADKSGLITLIAKKIRPLMRFIFPEEKNQKTIAMMVMSFIANIFGAGNSATVFSLKSMEMLDAENGRSPYASNTMCMFIAVSTTMIQLVPVTVVKVRTDLGSQDPGSIIIPSIVAGLVSMAVTILIAKLFERKSKNVSGL